MLLKNKSIEELLDMEEELRVSKTVEEDGSLYPFIQLYEELYRKINRDRDSVYAISLVQIKKMLISYLIRYGTYMKTQYQKDDHAAKSHLLKAIQYQREIPIAHYRLGFLHYKKRQYLEAMQHFENATQYQNSCDEEEYKLNQQQLHHAFLYLTNSALYIAEKAQSSLHNLELEGNFEKLPQYEMSSFFEMINQNEGYLAANAYTVVTSDGKRMCSKEACEKMVDDNDLPDHLVLYFSDRQHSLFYNGREVNLSINKAEMLRYLLLHSNEESPAMKHHFDRIIESKNENGEILDNTYTRNIKRVREKIEEVGVSIPIIDNKQFRGQRAYYYNHTIPYTIIHRSDDHFILD